MESTVIYNDTNGIKITDSEILIEDREYKLDKIKEIKLLEVPSKKAPGIVLFITGLILMILGSLDIFHMIYEYSENTYFNPDMLAIIAGVISVIAAVVVSTFSSPEYVLKITTQKGEEWPVRSENKDYISGIVNSLKRAYYRFLKNKVK